jgi:hypothetical protein
VRNFVGEVRPRFVRRYAELDSTVTAAFRAYADDVRAGRFPAPEHCYPIDPAAEDAIRAARVARRVPRATRAAAPVARAPAAPREAAL